MKRAERMTAQGLSADPWSALDGASRGARVLDLIVASLALIFFAPLMLGICLLVRLDSPGPVLFGQARLGRGGRTFVCLKFRSMVVDADRRLESLLAADADARAEWAATHKLKRDPRITRLGSFLRTSSLDELPQLWNILRGDMAVVGPRPIVAGEVGYYGEHFASYKAVRPGITGLWQISGRNDTTYAERVALDVSYVQRKSLALDLRILFATIPAVILRRGSY
jgi:exopolysaccharide production protein ExoY